MAESEICAAQVAADLADLRRRIAQLESTAGQRKLVEEALRLSEARYRSLVENLPVGVYRTTPGAEGKFLVANSAFLSMFGFESEDELKQTSVAGLYYCPEDRKAFSDDLLQRGQVVGQEIHLRKKDGTPMWGAVTARLVRDPYLDVAYFDNLIEDVTERRQAECALLHRLAVEQMVTSISSRFIDAAADRVESEIYQALRDVGEFAGADYCHVTVFSADGSAIVEHYEWHAGDALPLRDSIRAMSSKSVKWLTDMLKSSGILRVYDVASLPPDAIAVRQMWQERGIQSGAAVPLYQGGALAGYLAFDSRHVGSTGSDEDISLLRVVGEVFLSALARRRVEEAVRASQLLYQTTLDTMRDPIHVVDSELNLNLFNAAFVRWCAEIGLEHTNAVGRHLFDVFPFLPHRVREEYQHVFASAQTLRTEESTWIRGRELITETLKIPSIENESVARVVTIVRDVTEQRQADRLEKALYRISEAATSAGDLQSLFALVHKIVSQLIPARNLYIALYDETADLVTFPYYVDEYDIPPVEGSPVRSGRGITEYLLRKSAPVLLSEEEANDLTKRGEFELLGSPCRYWLGVPLKTADGKTIGVLVVQTYEENERYEEKDKNLLVFVSTQIAMAIERKKAEEALRSSEEHFRTIFQSAGAGISLHSVDTGRFVDANHALQGMLGHSVEELTRLTWADLCHPEDRDRSLDLVQAAALGALETPQLEKRFLHRDGSIMWARVALSLVLDSERRPQYALAVTQDITDRMQAEQEREQLQAQFLQAQKMEAIGRLTAGIAHDFNNMLTVINGYAERVRTQLPTDDPLYDQVEKILRAGWRAADLVRQLLVFSRKQIGEPQVMNLNVVVTELDMMLRRIIGEDIGFKTTLTPDLWPVEVDPSHIEQVLVNLAVNARDAMPEGGWLSIETANATLDDTCTDGQPRVRPGEYVCLAVSDTGTGMSEKVKAHLVEPFFTTKPQGKGTGLGLATAYSVVERSGGHIQVDSEEGKGTAFRIYLPRACQAAEPAVRALAAEDAPGGHETILLVEDDESMGELACNVLRGRGYTVIVAADGQSALDAAAEHSGPIQLLVADVVLPGISGVTVSERLRVARPEVKVLFMSGYAEDTMERYGITTPRFSLLKKPFGPAEMCQTVRSVLDS